MGHLNDTEDLVIAGQPLATERLHMCVRNKHKVAMKLNVVAKPPDYL